MATQDDSNQPTPAPDNQPGADLAANVIREKLHQLFQEESEPQAKAELAEIEHSPHLSKHQRYMQELSSSGRSLAEIQAAWHEYYTKLPDHEKHQVWQEFYKASQHAQPLPQEPAATTPQVFEHHAAPRHKRKTGLKTVSDMKRQLMTASPRRHQKLSAKHHVQSIAFGLAMGSVVILILLFGFFNDRFLAPFITPSRNVSSTAIIADSSSAAGPNSEIIIPKINVEIPVVYDQSSVEEAAIQKSLENGVVHYASTPAPGEKGNIAIVGHSSNNILNHGRYKFAFVLLSRLDNGDTFYLTKGGKRYVYKVYKKQIVEANDVAVLGANEKAASATLITCDPPGTSLHRLVVVGEQISPDPNLNGVSTAVKTDTRPTQLAGNAPSLWSRIVHWFTS
ncbi:MAG: hypothetical protein JWS12_778 [Candidatus Saccharibacteria bacterium]|nr:hypothetical protein [Candidatus Saccharibacteria bacterium]